MAKKKYSIQWENDLPVSFEVNGVSYESLDDVPDEGDRRKLEAMLNSSFEDEFNDPEFDAEFDRLQKETSQINGVAVEKVILWVFTGVAVLMLLIAGISSFSAAMKMGGEASAPGRVVDMIKRQEYVSQQDRIIRDYYYPVVEYVSSDGKSHTVQ